MCYSSLYIVRSAAAAAAAPQPYVRMYCVFAWMCVCAYACVDVCVSIVYTANAAVYGFDIFIQWSCRKCQ